MMRRPAMLGILCVLWIACPVSGQEALTFDAFIAPFAPEVQAQARVIWEQAAQELPDRAAPTPPAEQEVSDEALATAVGMEDNASFLATLKDLRGRLQDARHETERARRELARWTAFARRLDETPPLGAVYLKALWAVRQCEAQVRESEAVVSELNKKIESQRVDVALDKVSSNFTVTDWVVIVAYLIFTTILGGVLAGKQASMKDFFLGGRKLPWPAVCGSIIATEVSAATFLIAPALVFSRGGDMTYIQLALGTIVARFIIGYFFIPVYYQREVYSPYDYMGRQLGPRVRTITSVLFMVGGILAQGARVYIAAKALQVITGTDTTTSILVIGLISIIWTVMGGITTVIWTDAIQCVLFIFGAVAALAFAAWSVKGGLPAVVSEAYDAGRLRVLNLNLNPHEAYTLWCGLIGFSFLTLASHGTDQLLVQRMFTCKNQVDARKAIIVSSFSQVLTYLLLFVGAGLFVYYKHTPLTASERVIVNNDSMKVFAVYIVNVMPPVLSGLLMAAIFATAISTLDSLLAALSETTISILYRPFIRSQASDRHYVRASRLIVVLWGILLTAFAVYCDVIARSYADLIQFALAMAAYTYGALLGAFLLAFLPVRRDDLGLLWGVPLSMLTVFALNWHQTAPQVIVLVSVLVLLATAFRRLRGQPQKVLYVGLAALVVMILSMAVIGRTPDGQPVHITLAWPWHFPIGTAMTFVIGVLVGNPRKPDSVHP